MTNTDGPVVVVDLITAEDTGNLCDTCSDLIDRGNSSRFCPTATGPTTTAANPIQKSSSPQAAAVPSPGTTKRLS